MMWIFVVQVGKRENKASDFHGFNYNYNTCIKMKTVPLKCFVSLKLLEEELEMLSFLLTIQLLEDS